MRCRPRRRGQASASGLPWRRVERPRAGRDRRARGRANRLRAGDRADPPPSRPVRRGPEPRRRRRCAAPAASGTPLAPRLKRRDCPAKPGTAERGTVARRGGTARRSPARRPGTPRGPFGANPGLDPRVRRRHNDVSHRHVTGWLGGPASPVMGMGPRSERRPPATGHASGAVVPAKVRAPRVRWLPRERLDKLLPQLWAHRLALVVAPAGSGKTTLLAGWAAMADHPVAWYRAESTDGSEASLVACLEAAFASAVADLPRGWTSVEDAAAALESAPSTKTLLIVDDLHTLTGSPAEAAFERFIDYAPPAVAVLAASRTVPPFNLSRRRVSGALVEIGQDDLRFRSWEVERLFRDFYDDALRPDELARLARRTEGWAAGLQLFHLATRGKPRDERLRILAGLGSSPRFVRDYLARNVVAELPDALRDFLVRTSVLRRLSGPLCDALLARSGSRALLEELERRSVFTVALDDEGTFRYHEVLRSHLEAMLVAEAGEQGARAQARRAGELLVAAGAVASGS